MTDPRTGGCLCGEVRFEVNGVVRDVIVCHCSLCRRAGTLGGAYVGASRDGLSIVGGDTLAVYVDARGRERSFCSSCGASLFWRDSDDDDVSIAAGALDDDTGLCVLRHIHVESAASWEAGSAEAPVHLHGSTSPALARE